MLELPFLNEIKTKENKTLTNKKISIVHLNKHSLKSKDITSFLPEEVYMHILRFLTPKELARGISLVNKKNQQLWNQAVHTFEVQGNLRKLKEDDLVKIIKSFNYLENLNFCNTGSSDDFQLTGNLKNNIR
jgi:hypothetical protein